MKILALDTSTEACSVALWLDGDVRERFELGSQHSERILPMVDVLLAEAGIKLVQLEALVFGRGPGSFTGLRIAAGVAQGLAFGANLPVVPVSSLAVLAQGQDADKVLAALDARMQQVYWGAYLRSPQGLMELQGVEQVLAPEQVSLPQGEGWSGAGPGWDVYHAALQARLDRHLKTWQAQQFPHARHLAELGVAAFQAGQAVAADQAVPVYIRDDVAVKSVRR